MPKQYQCQSCRQTFGKNKESYKKHIKRCRMPPTAEEERIIHFTEQVATAQQLLQREDQRHILSGPPPQPAPLPPGIIINQPNPTIQDSTPRYPLFGVLNNQGLYPHFFQRPQPVPFPQDNTPGPFQFPMANYLLLHRLNEPNIMDLIQQSISQLRPPYLLEKTKQQWRYLRQRHLQGYKKGGNLRSSINSIIYFEQNAVISGQMWLDLAHYYNRTIQCVPGVTFFTQLPDECEQRNFAVKPRAPIPPRPRQKTQEQIRKENETRRAFSMKKYSPEMQRQLIKKAHQRYLLRHPPSPFNIHERTELQDALQLVDESVQAPQPSGGRKKRVDDAPLLTRVIGRNKTKKIAKKNQKKEESQSSEVSSDSPISE